MSRSIKQAQNPKTKKLKDVIVFTSALNELFDLIINKDAYNYKISSEEIAAFVEYANLLNEKAYIVTTDRIEDELITKIATTTNWSSIWSF